MLIRYGLTAAQFPGAAFCPSGAVTDVGARRFDPRKEWSAVFASNILYETILARDGRFGFL